MTKKFRSRLGIKLFCMLAVIIVMTVVPLSYTSIMLIDQYGDEAAYLNEQQLLSLAQNYLHQVTDEKAKRYQEFFNRISSSAALLGSQATQIYSNLEFYGDNPFQQYVFAKSPSNGIFGNSKDDPVVTLYWGAQEISPRIQHELDALSHLSPFLNLIIAENREVLASHSITESGIGIYCTSKPESKEAALSLPPPLAFDLRDGLPMTVFSQSREITNGVRWTSIYKDDVIDGYMLTASAPIFDDRNNFRGITGIDVPLDTITNDVINYGNQHNTSPVLFSFLLGNDSQVIALPEKYYDIFGLSVDHSAYTHSDELLELHLNQSSITSVRDLSTKLISHKTYFSKLSLGDDTYYVSSSKLQQQGWIVGVVTREKELLSSVQESRSALTDTIKNLKDKGLLLTLVSVLTAMLVISLLLRHLINPLRHLAAATQRVADGDLSVRSLVSTSDEVGVLANSFNAMVSQLEEAQHKQKEYMESLKHEVEIQNSELITQKGELEEAIQKLKKEEQHHQLVAEALFNIQQQYFEALESTTAGAYIIEDGLLTYVNNSFAHKIFNVAKEHLIGRDPLDLIHEKDRAQVADNIEKRFKGEEIPPYVITCIRDDGTTFPAEVWSKVSTWQEKQVLIGTITDVTSLKRSEEQLRVKENELTKSLAEKEVLLKEIYHRTKNNMLVIISLLDLQAQEAQDEKLREMFQVTENRIRSMALVHEKLYESKNLSEIDMASYLRELCESILDTMVLHDRIKLVSRTKPIGISIDYAVPLGLVVNEIVMNAIKHAFPDGRSGIVFLGVEKLPDDNILLTISDDGVGLPDQIDLQSTASFGLGIIVSSLVKMQLKGEITVDRSGGTRYLITFPHPQSTTRI